MFCLTLTDLKYNKTYTISIAAQNQGIPYKASETELSGTTLVKVPQPTQHLIASWNSTQFLDLEQEHLYKTNGTYLGFEISVNGQKFFHKGLENVTYTHQVLINCHNFTVLLPTIENTETISVLYIVVLTSQQDHIGDCRDNIESIHDSLVPIKENQTCWIVGHYELKEYKDIEDTELNINILEMAEFTCTEKLYEEGILIVNELAPNKVRNLTIISSSSSKLNVVWKAPTPVLGIITNYVVTWMFFDKRGCKIANRISNIQSTYSTYNITVSAVTKKGQGDIENILGFTDVAETIDINTFNRRIITLETSIQIGLVVDCEHWNGPIYLNAYAICMSEWCEGQWVNITKHMQYNDITTLDSVLPYTNYKLEVNIFRNKMDRINDYNKSWSTVWMTLSGVPNQIPFAEVYSLSETSLSLRWSPPYPPTGILDSFVIKYYYTSEEHSTPQTYINYLSPCKIWTNMYCTTLTNLIPNKNYIISIAGQNQGISEYGLETILNETTLIGVPQPPVNLVANWNESRFLELQWQHPNKTNGPLLKFEIIVNGQQYYHETPFQCKLDTHQAIVSIQTVNSKFTSALLTQQYVCPILKPSLSTEPFLRQNDNNSITISMSNIHNDEAISNLYIIFLANKLDDTSDCREKLEENHKSLVPIKEKQRCWIVGHYQKSEYKDIVGTDVNINLSQIPGFNCTGELCEIGILIVNELDDQISSNWYLAKQSKLENTEFPNMFEFFLLLTTIIINIILILVYWRNIRPREDTNTPYLRHSNTPDHQLLPMEEFSSSEDKNEKYSRLVAVDQFYEYVKSVANGYELTTEFNEIFALTQKNDKLRHVYSAVECFDATYIASPFYDKAYIFCSAPTVSNHYLFWKMIIEEEIENIVLFASTDDIKNEKLFQYWPDNRSIESILLSNIKVTAMKVYPFKSYKIHHFRVQQANIVRQTRFLHFTNWDKDGTQIYPRSIDSFLQLLQTIKDLPHRPILVHTFGKHNVCAGLFILVHISIQQAQQEAQVDICHQVQNLRTQRPNCIDSVEEYLFAHLVLLEYISIPQHAYPCEYYPVIYKKLDKDKLRHEMKNIEDSIRLMKLLRTRYPIFNNNDNPENKEQYILPHSSRSVFLSPSIDDNSCNCIAVFVDGYKQLNKFIVIQHPLNNTVDEFWKIVMDNNVHLTISLQTAYHIKPWISDGHFITPKGLTVTHLKGFESDHFHMHTFRLKQKEVSMEYKKVYIIEVKGWNVGQVLPHSLTTLVKTKLQMNKITCPEFSSILVMCRNGATASGLFIATCNLVDSIESEHVVDVFTTVRNIRNNRRQFVTDEIQLRALFDIATLYLNDDDEFTNH
ncbi:receptor-type tyrosine-protein phosphatase delta-like [Atheta coriaria]|uniref:receptor-type tyrosine-protein phosphatase delta-like n=1 Tax=Dalotia coriaria TaxID=877792 RepID=UPI0031F40FB5